MLAIAPASYALFLLAYVVPIALGNTEIVNFDAVFAEDRHEPPSHWPVLSDTGPATWLTAAAPRSVPFERLCPQDSVNCPYETWVVLDLDTPAWSGFSKFTVRLSWPANYPADFDVKIVPPSSLLSPSSSTGISDVGETETAGHSRRQYARIRAVDAGVRPPHSAHLRPEALFMLILEPLYFGVLPASVIPTLLFLVPVVLVAGFVVTPRVYGYLSQAASQVAQEAESDSNRKSE